MFSQFWGIFQTSIVPLRWGISKLVTQMSEEKTMSIASPKFPIFFSTFWFKVVHSTTATYSTMWCEQTTHIYVTKVMIYVLFGSSRLVFVKSHDLSTFFSPIYVCRFISLDHDKDDHCWRREEEQPLYGRQRAAAGWMGVCCQCFGIWSIFQAQYHLEWDSLTENKRRDKS